MLNQMNVLWQDVLKPLNLNSPHLLSELFYDTFLFCLIYEIEN